jgi:hypothetical protein
VAHLFHVNGFALVVKGSVASYHEGIRNPRKIGGQIVSNPIREVFLIRIVRQVRKGQHDDRQARRDEGLHDGGGGCRDRRWRRGSGSCCGPTPPCDDGDDERH